MEQTNANVRLLDTLEFANACGVARNTLKYWIETSKITPYTIINNHKFFTQQQVIDYYKHRIISKEINRGLFICVGSKTFTDKVSLGIKQQLANARKKNHAICLTESLDNYIQNKLSIETDKDKSGTDICKESVFKEFANAYKNFVHRTIMSLYFINENLRDTTYNKLLEIALDLFDESDEQPFNDMLGNSSWLSVKEIQLQFSKGFNELCSDYGVSKIMAENIVTKEQLYRGKYTKLMPKILALPFDITEDNKKAYAIYQNFITRFTSDFHKIMFKDIMSNGYFLVNSINTDEEVEKIVPEILQMLVNKEFTEIKIIAEDGFELQNISKLDIFSHAFQYKATPLSNMVDWKLVMKK